MTSRINPGPALPTDDAKALAEYMSDMSEEAFSAVWLADLEYSLWYAVKNGPRDYGWLPITQKHIQDLISLSDHCNGWIIFNRQEGQKWIPIEEWERRYNENIDRLVAQKGFL